MCAIEERFIEVRFVEVCSLKGDLVKVRSAEVRCIKVRVAEIRFAKACLVEIRVAEVCAAEIRIAEVRGDGVLAPPLIPRLDTFLDFAGLPPLGPPGDSL